MADIQSAPQLDDLWNALSGEGQQKRCAIEALAVASLPVLDRFLRRFPGEAAALFKREDEGTLPLFSAEKDRLLKALDALPDFLLTPQARLAGLGRIAEIDQAARVHGDISVLMKCEEVASQITFPAFFSLGLDDLMMPDFSSLEDLAVITELPPELLEKIADDAVGPIVVVPRRKKDESAESP